MSDKSPLTSWSFEANIVELSSEDSGQVTVAYGLSDVEEAETPCPLYVHLLAAGDDQPVLEGLRGRRVRITIEEVSDETDLTEADAQRMWDRGEPVELTRAPLHPEGVERWVTEARAWLGRDSDDGGLIHVSRLLRCLEPLADSEWWTTSDVATYLGVTLSTVSTYRHRQQMPQPDGMIGRSHVWRPARIIEWNESRPRRQ